MFRRKEPKLRIKVKQNRYEKFIIDELSVSGNTTNELILDLAEALQAALVQLDEMNGVKQWLYLFKIQSVPTLKNNGL